MKKSRTDSDFLKRARTKLVVVLAAMAVLVSTHLGEFWPFSIYPMFSQAGKTWTRALVRDYSSLEDSLIWHPVELESLPGDPVALRRHGIETNDLANFIEKNTEWTAERVTSVSALFEGRVDRNRLMILRARGRLTEGIRPQTRVEPFILLTGEGWILNPHFENIDD